MLLPILASADYSGYCGDKVTYYYEEITKTLTISGQGEMTDYYKSSSPVSPWRGIEIKKVVIGDGVTSIGSYAFYGCSSMTSVNIPNSVTFIGHNAFEDCSGLTSLTIGNGVKSIGYEAFSDCSGLTSLTIGNSVTNIGNEAFICCSGLTSLTIGNSVTSIGRCAFANCHLLTSVDIPNSVESIGESAFASCGLTSITIPNNVKSIGNNAFDYCSDLTTIVSEIDNPFEIGKNSNNMYNAVTLIVPVGTKDKYKSTLGWNGFNVVEFGEGGIDGKRIEVEGVYYEIGSNNNVFLTSNNQKYSGDFLIQNQVAFNGKKYDVTSIGQSAFSGCIGLTSVSIPSSITSIGQFAFDGCSALASVTIPNSVITIGARTFYNCGLTSVTIPNSVTSIGKMAFAYCTDLTSITIPNSVVDIEDNAFNGCISLTSAIIGSSVKSIGYDAFGNTNLKKTIWLTNTPPSGYNYASGAVNYVSNDQFSSLSNTLKYQFLSSYFEVDGVRYVPISPSDRTCDAIDLVSDECSTNTIIESKVVYKGVTMNVKNINPYLAYNNKNIKTLSIDPEGVVSDFAFAECSNMKSITLGKKVSAIGSYAFQGCSSLETVDIPDIVTVLNDYTFSNCTSLKEIKINPNITKINNSVFNNCTSLKKVIIVDSDTELYLGYNSISYYSGYTGTPLFADCPLDYVYIGRDLVYNSEEKYSYSPFYRNTTLREVKITDKETEILENEFYGCNNLQRITIGDGVTSIGKWAFSGCQSLKFFAFGSQVKTIGQEAFSDCSAVVEISSKAKTAPVCGTQALDDINKWECKLYVPEGCLTDYQVADQWKDFFFMEEGTGTNWQDIIGDANGDGVVDDADIKEIVNYIMGVPSSKFIFNNADANGDNTVNVVDIVIVGNIIKEDNQTHKGW